MRSQLPIQIRWLLLVIALGVVGLGATIFWRTYNRSETHKILNSSTHKEILSGLKRDSERSVLLNYLETLALVGRDSEAARGAALYGGKEAERTGGLSRELGEWFGRTGAVNRAEMLVDDLPTAVSRYYFTVGLASGLLESKRFPDAKKIAEKVTYLRKNSQNTIQGNHSEEVYLKCVLAGAGIIGEMDLEEVEATPACWIDSAKAKKLHGEVASRFLRETKSTTWTSWKYFQDYFTGRILLAVELEKAGLAAAEAWADAERLAQKIVYIRSTGRESVQRSDAKDQRDWALEELVYGYTVVGRRADADRVFRLVGSPNVRHLAKLLVNVNRPVEADTLYPKALEAANRPQDPWTRNSLHCLLASEDYHADNIPRARKTLSQMAGLIDSAPINSRSDWESAVQLVRGWNALGEISQAMRLADALENNPNSSMYGNERRMALLQAELGKSMTGLLWARKTDATDRSRTLLEGAKALIKRGDMESAALWIRNLDPQEWRSREALRNGGHIPAALRWIDQYEGPENRLIVYAAVLRHEYFFEHSTAKELWQASKPQDPEPEGSASPFYF